MIPHFFLLGKIKTFTVNGFICVADDTIQEVRFLTFNKTAQDVGRRKAYISRYTSFLTFAMSSQWLDSTKRH